MHLAPRDIDKLLLHNAGFLAQKRLARGLRLNYPETVALLATQLLELIRDGKHDVATLMNVGKQLLGRNQVLPGVAGLVHEVQVEGTFPDGTKLVTVHEPICVDDGDLNLALYGSFLPVPELSVFGATADKVVGAFEVAAGEIELYAGRTRTTLQVTSTGDRPIQVGSHYPFSDTNRALVFDRAQAKGKHLDIPAGTAIRFEPGETRTVVLVDDASTVIDPSLPTPRQLADQFDGRSAS